MMDGSSLRIIVGTYSALGTLEEISWQEEEGQEEDEGVSFAQKQSNNEWLHTSVITFLKMETSSE